MKKIMIALILSLAVLCASAAVAEEGALPADIRDALEKRIAEGYRLQEDAGLEKEGYWFAVLQNEAGHNLLEAFQRENGQWTRYLETDKAVPQGSKLLTVFVNEEGAQHEMNDISLPVAGPTVTIGQANSDRAEEEEYLERWAEFALEGGRWMLAFWEDFDACAVRFTGNELIYFESWLAGWDYLGTVKGDFQRDIRYMNWNNVPRTLKDAQRKISSAPTLPEGKLKAQQVKAFPGGRQYAVYSGPGENYLRGGKGKAVVSTNDWIQVFGKENGWILIQYAIEKDHRRFGWIPEEALAKGAEVAECQFSQARVYTLEETFLTDDPLFSQAMLSPVPECNFVTWLSSLGDWAYVEWLDDMETDDGEAEMKPVRGFIKAKLLVRLEREEAVRTAADFLLSRKPVIAQQPVTLQMLSDAAADAVYDAETQEWTVTFTVSGCGFTVIVDDVSGYGVRLEADNG